MARRKLSTLMDGYSNFVAEGIERLIAGEDEYSDTPAEGRPLSELVQEIREECVDTAVWAYLTYKRVTALADKIAALEAAESPEDYVYIDVDTRGRYHGPICETSIGCPHPDGY